MEIDCRPKPWGFFNPPRRLDQPERVQHHAGDGAWPWSVLGVREERGCRDEVVERQVDRDVAIRRSSALLAAGRRLWRARPRGVVRRFTEWLAIVAGAPLPRAAFLAINVAAGLFINGLLHMLAGVVTGTYSPGLFTSVVLYLPLGGLALLRA